MKKIRVTTPNATVDVEGDNFNVFDGYLAITTGDVDQRKTVAIFRQWSAAVVVGESDTPRRESLADALLVRVVK